MLSVADETGLEKLLRPLGKRMSRELAETLSTMKADPETQARYDALAQRANHGTLSEQEREELESLVRANSLLGLLKAEAQLLLKQL